MLTTNYFRLLVSLTLYFLITLTLLYYHQFVMQKGIQLHQTITLWKKTLQQLLTLNQRKVRL